MIISRAVLLSIFAGIVLEGCSAVSPPSSAPDVSAPTKDAATRTMPVVPGRPARVFVFAGFDTACASLAAPVVTMTAAPMKGDITFRPGQETNVATSATGACTGRKVIGTGVYYTARPGASGVDSFAVAAKLATGEMVSRSFEVTIAE
jgi:hypothetical protein